MHKGRTLDAFKVWKRIRGVETAESREEFYYMAAGVSQEETEVNEGAQNRRFPWMDFFTYVLRAEFHLPGIPYELASLTLATYKVFPAPVELLFTQTS